MTPLMRQYHVIKEQFPEALVFFQVGDFYELFYEDAQRASQFLGITLTKRGMSAGVPIPLCGVPCHAIDHYLIKLINGGFRVVICDQCSEPEPGKLVERRVSRVLTPGILHSEQLLDPKESALLAVVHEWHDYLVLLTCEVVVGRVMLTVLPKTQWHLVEAELMRLTPRELLCSVSAGISLRLEAWAALHGVSVTPSVHCADAAVTQEWIRTCTDVTTAALIETSVGMLGAAGMLYAYLQKHIPEVCTKMRTMQVYSPRDFLLIDAATQRNLELVSSLVDGVRGGTVWQVLDHAVTAMGSRMIKRWLLQPLYNRTALAQRQELVQACIDDVLVRNGLQQLLAEVGDLERVAGRIVLGRAPVSDYYRLRRAVHAVRDMRRLVQQHAVLRIVPLTVRHGAELDAIATYVTALLPDEEGQGLVRAGFSTELDQLRALCENHDHAVLQFEERERQATGIGSLKVRSNGIHGYALEITKTHKAAVPSHYRLVQTLVNRDRFVTDELVQLERILVDARQRVELLEKELFEELCTFVSQRSALIQQSADELAQLDGILGLAQAAVVHRYVRPQVNEERVYRIVGGRHPVVERMLPEHASFIANDLLLTPQERMWIITGPNMGGKSTFLRQVAVLAIMAQAGSWVPATALSLPLFDRICTRIGAADSMLEGKSTFFMEMEDVARICADATTESLVLLDEVGRGTGTYDGMAVAQAVLEYLCDVTKPYVLCATHYHEVAQVMCSSGRGIGAYHVAVAVCEGELVLLHRIKPGLAEGSFGLSVAEKAGLPAAVCARARALLPSFKL